MDCEAAGALKPDLVACARKRLEEREAVARSAMAEAVALLVLVCARLPDELGAGEEKILVEIFPGTGEDAWGAGAPLETDPTIARTCELPTRSAGPVASPSLRKACRASTAEVSRARASSRSNPSRQSVLPAAP